MPKAVLCFPLGRSLQYLQSHLRDRLWWKEVGSNKTGVCFIGLCRPMPLVIKIQKSIKAKPQEISTLSGMVRQIQMQKFLNQSSAEPHRI